MISNNSLYNRFIRGQLLLSSYLQELVAKSEAAFLNIGGNLSKAIPSKLTATCRQLAIWVYTEIYSSFLYSRILNNALSRNNARKILSPYSQQ